MLNDVRLDMGGKVYTTIKNVNSNTCHFIRYINASEGMT